MKTNNQTTVDNRLSILHAKISRSHLVYFVLFTLFIAALFSFRLIGENPYITFYEWPKSLANGLIVAIALLCFGYYLALRKGKQLSNPRVRNFLALLTLFTIFTIKGSGIISLYLVPVAFATALVTLFVDVETGLVLAAFFPILIGIEAGVMGSFGPVVVSYIGGLVGVLGANDVRRTFDLTKIGLAVGFINIILVISFRLPFLNLAAIGGWDWTRYSWAGLNGLVAALFIAGAIPLAERFTQKTSPIGLMELLNPSHPLLERLQQEAPGTYHHSKNIASLSESAARAIDANPLLTTAGAYYHDIGKMARPEFFIENQEPGSNPHDELTASMSKIVLTSHIQQGVELGKSYGLKEDILQFIPTHHGTSVIRYFYLKALREKREDSELAQEQFQYEAPLPRTKETSIVALADPVEAASHTLEDVRGTEVEEMVEEEIQTKIDEGQLAESPLTLADIKIIKQQFINSLRAMSQNRVKNYPTDKEAVAEESDSLHPKDRTR